MKILKGKLLTQPQQWEGTVVFLLRTGKKTVTVIREKREDQKRDVLFLCRGQRIVLWTRSPGCCVLAEKIRIVNYQKRNYLRSPEEYYEV